MRNRHAWFGRTNSFVVAVVLFSTLPLFAFQSKKTSPAQAAKKSSGSATGAIRKLDDTLEPIRKKHQLPALAAAVKQGDRIVAIGAVGVRQLGAPETVTADDKFHLGSISKPMTATMIGILVDRQKLTWTSTIVAAFPALKEQIRSEYHNVTLEQLLMHRSGLAEDRSPDPAIVKQLRALSGDPREQRLKMVEIVLQTAPAAAPGTKNIYSNYGYCVAAAMAETAMEKSWEELMGELLFEPLGMESAGFGPPSSSEVIDQPRGHTGEPGSFAPAKPTSDNPPCLGPSSRVHCSLEDLAKFGSLHVRYDKETAKLLTRATFDKLHADSLKQGYSLGWDVKHPEWAQGDLYWHTGTNGMNFAGLYVAPKRDTVIVIATNAKAKDACQEVLETLVGKTNRSAGKK